MTIEPASRPTVAQNAWGRVDDRGEVFVRMGDTERKIGSWQVGEPEQALTFFGRKYDDLAVQVDLLEQRLASGAAAPDETHGGVQRLREALAEANAIGDLAALSQRLDAIDAQVAARRAERRAERAQALDEARSPQGRRSSVRPKPSPKGTTGVTAPTGCERCSRSGRRCRGSTAPPTTRCGADSPEPAPSTRAGESPISPNWPSGADKALAVKEEIVAEAEAMAGSTEWGATARRYRDLMTRWKAAGPAPEAGRRHAVAALSGQPRTRSSRPGPTDLTKRDTEQRTHLEAKQALLAEAEALVPVTDWKAARESLRSVHERWEAAGHVPRDTMRSIEGRLRRVEDAVRDAEQQEWRRTNPQARARIEDTVAQLRASIAELENQLAAAQAAGDAEKARTAEDALSARRSWLEQADRALDEFGG